MISLRWMTLIYKLQSWQTGRGAYAVGTCFHIEKKDGGKLLSCNIQMFSSEVEVWRWS